MKFNYGSNDSNGSTSNYLRLKDGDSHVGVLRGDPYEYEVHWLNGKSADCTGPSCLKCEAGDKAKFRFKVNFIVQENGAYVPRVWEAGWSVYIQLRELTDNGYKLEQTLVKVGRKGSTMNDTVYTVLPTPNHQVDAVTLGQLDSVPLTTWGVTTVDENVPF